MRTRRTLQLLCLLAALCLAAALTTTACSGASANADGEPAEPPPLPEDPGEGPTVGADPDANAQHDARMAATQTGPIGGDATKTGDTPTESKLTDFDHLDINAVLKDRRGELTSCYDDALAIVELPPEGFLVKAKFTIEADGTVAGAEVVEATERFADAEQCFLMKLATTTFPAPPEGRVIETTYPFTIKRKLKQQ